MDTCRKITYWIVLLICLWLPVKVQAPLNSLLVSSYLNGKLSPILTDIKDIEFYDAITGRNIEQLKELIKNKYPKLDKIITCESQWINQCNQKYGCKAGIGLGQLIPSTKRYCEEKLRMSINPFDERDNLICSLWLYLYEGNSHWKQSEKCWKPLDKRFGF